MKKIIFLFLIPYSFLLSTMAYAQENLGDKEYIIVKDYKPVLAESFKISETPEADTTSSMPPSLHYSITPKKIETSYEAGVIKAVKLKDEPISKLYRNFLKLGLGNYSTFYGELFMNSLRSKTGSIGLHLKHFSGSPTLNDAGNANFSDNDAVVDGKYFFDNSTFSGDFGYNRNVLHYYGYNTSDDSLHLVNQKTNTPDSIRQRFNHFDLNLGLQSNYTGKGNLDYDLHFRFHSISDLYDVSEPDIIVSAQAGKPVDEHYYSLLASFDYFKKSDANYERLYADPLNHNLSRNIIRIEPQMKMDKDRVHLLFGINLGMEKNLSELVHVFPKAEVSVPIAEHILTAFAGVDGNIEKNNFKTLTDENPFTTSSVIMKNTIHKLVIKGGLKGNFSNTISFSASVNYDQVKDLQLFYNDSMFRNKFNVLYDDANVFNIHAELSYFNGGKLNVSLHVDQNSYSMNLQPKAWHKPGSMVALVAKYNLGDKVLADVSLFAHGVQYARISDGNYILAEKINSYLDANLGLEYRYSKILSFYMHLNNLGFTRYYQWSQVPSERFNLLGGLTYSF
ncbi:MAG: hypothetical protein NT126_05095 [Bacteroidetes bacterium]|nr:hypothetical protein [Bacteroidota bacterium]